MVRYLSETSWRLLCLNIGLNRSILVPSREGDIPIQSPMNRGTTLFLTLFEAWEVMIEQPYSVLEMFGCSCWFRVLLQEKTTRRFFGTGSGWVSMNGCCSLSIARGYWYERLLFFSIRYRYWQQQPLLFSLNTKMLVGTWRLDMEVHLRSHWLCLGQLCVDDPWCWRLTRAVIQTTVCRETPRYKSDPIKVLWCHQEIRSSDRPRAEMPIIQARGRYRCCSSRSSLVLACTCLFGQNGEIANLHGLFTNVAFAD
jgi:hypothetical protein